MLRLVRMKPLLLAALLIAANAAAQETANGTATGTAAPPSLDAPNDAEIFKDEPLPVAPSPYNPGDQIFSIELGTALPLVFFKADGSALINKINLGGAGNLNFDYFLTENLAIGGEFGGMFASTLGSNMLYVLPFGVRATWQINVKSFEFPLSLMIGAASQTYLTTNYLGLFVKPAAAAYWRFNPDWSFGGGASWWWLPQWTGDGKTAYGNFLEFSLGTRYHF